MLNLISEGNTDWTRSYFFFSQTVQSKMKTTDVLCYLVSSIYAIGGSVYIGKVFGRAIKQNLSTWKGNSLWLSNSTSENLPSWLSTYVHKEACARMQSIMVHPNQKSTVAVPPCALSCKYPHVFNLFWPVKKANYVDHYFLSDSIYVKLKKNYTHVACLNAYICR